MSRYWCFRIWGYYEKKSRKIKEKMKGVEQPPPEVRSRRPTSLVEIKQESLPQCGTRKPALLPAFWPLGSHGSPKLFHRLQPHDLCKQTRSVDFFNILLLYYLSNSYFDFFYFSLYWAYSLFKLWALENFPGNPMSISGLISMKPSLAPFMDFSNMLRLKESSSISSHSNKWKSTMRRDLGTISLLKKSEKSGKDMGNQHSLQSQYQSWMAHWKAYEKSMNSGKISL